MQKFARIDAGRVVEIIVLSSGQSPADLFHPDIARHFEPCGPNVELSWMKTGEAFLPPSEPAIDLSAYAANRRWQIETGGIIFSGVPVATDDRSKIMIMGARLAAEADPEWSTVWHGADGNTYPVDATAMVAISDAVQSHVNATFATFAAVKAAIEAGEIVTVVEIDTAFAA